MKTAGKTAFHKPHLNMASKIDKEKLRSAIEWIDKLANGVNPINDSILPGDDIVNNIHISRCLFYVAGLLENIGTPKTRSRKQYELEFQLSKEAAAKVCITEATGISMFVKEINKVIPENMKPLSTTQVTEWLVSVGYLEERQRNDGHKYKTPTELGTSIGITTVWKEGRQGGYLAVAYDTNAQNFILENLLNNVLSTEH